MPTYTYCCSKCEHKFELFFSYAEYQSSPLCIKCQSSDTQRSYSDDLSNAICSVRKHSSELKTIGDLANRNRDNMSDDQKIELYSKHNSYKDASTHKALPKGMKRIKKPKTKNKWT